MYYEELRDGSWQRISIDGEMLLGRAHHVIYFASPKTWLLYPEWARHRRAEIIARIQSQFREPDYEYADGGTASSATSLVQAHYTHPVATPGQKRALILVLAILLSITGGAPWLVNKSIASGSVWLPMKRASLQREVVREKEPALFWTSVGIYSAIGLGSLSLAICMLRWSRK